MSVPKTKVSLRLDRERTLLLNLNALCKAEEVTGMNLIVGEVIFTSLRVMRALLWAGLLHEDPTLTIEEAGDLIEDAEGEDGVHGVEYVLLKVVEAFGAGQPDPEPPADGEEPPDPQ